MRVDRLRQVAGRGPHFDRHHRLGEDVAGIDADDADAQDPLAVGIDQQLRKPSVRPSAMARPLAAQG